MGTNKNTVTNSEQEEVRQKAKAGLELAILKGIAAGLDVDGVFFDGEGRRQTLKVQLFGLTSAIITTNLAFFLYYADKQVCEFKHVKFAGPPEAVFMAFIYFGLSAMLAYGFSTGMAFIEKLTRGTAIHAILYKKSPDLDLSMPPTQLRDLQSGESKPAQESPPKDGDAPL